MRMLSQAGNWFSKLDAALLLLVVLPVLAWLSWLKWTAVMTSSPVSGLAAVDFLRLDLAYHGAIFLWCSVMLCRAGAQYLIRPITLLCFVFLAAESFQASTAIAITGALMPLGTAAYLAYSAGWSPLPINLSEAITALLMPALLVGLIFSKLYLVRIERGRNRMLPRILLWGLAGALVVAFPGPFHPDLELNTARPSYLYQMSQYLKSDQWVDAAIASEEMPPVRRAALVDRKGEGNPNLVFIVLESVGSRATNLGNTQRRLVTPHLQALAADSLVLERAYTAIPHTSKALVAMLCGTEPFYRYPIFESHLGIPARCLASLLDEHGYETAFFQSPTKNFENRSGLVAQMGFRSFRGGEDFTVSGFEPANYFGHEDAVMLEPSRQWLARQNGPFFAVYLTGTTHHPYWAPSRLGFQEFADGQDYEEKNRYLNAVRYLDWFVDQLLQQYKAAGAYDNTVFVIVGDHGESFIENGRRQHNASLYEETLAVPLLIHSPRWVEPAKDSRIVSLTDIVPSVVDIMGFDLVGETAGRSFIGGALPRNRAIAVCWYDDWCIASIDARYKYIYNFGEKKEELYDLSADPQETTNLAEQERDMAAVRRQELLQHYVENLRRYDRFYRRLRADYWSARGDSVSTPTALLALPLDDHRRTIRGFDKPTFSK
ncbi:MAG: LTA synthase family protein [Rhodocyclales bacterium]|nr:LTA synthase family protein [Rhodocyclales bacterium]